MSINLCLRREISSSGHGTLRFCGGKFRHKGNSTMAHDLIDHLHADASLMTELRHLDLAALIITLSGSQATIMLTPYGGGLAFLVMPPVRYAVAFPPDQIAMTARVVTRLERIVSGQSRDRGSRMTH
ncbi:hypothetical protein DesfrDRAFT_0684 [Solidesulfovibrio fructosivorans JJ]]|uniref:Uncharacterized protein n=2 Tax=Solidesulfovibrio fructosivorans TaxID=878 RepID=E1JSU5_SOLFR|nr:hypothetical protein DesfrDRAFT_0684 [Solidesulfovibrio fructosivorans JJ]]